MTTKPRFIPGALLLAAALFAVGCTRDPGTGTTAERITCTTTPDCVARGGTCVANQCHADNECATDADCSSGQTCVADPDFGGLCAAAGTNPEVLPPWSCTTGKDCPTLEGCGSDQTCHVDGECHNTWQGDLLVGDCAGDLLCAASGANLDGFCTEGRGGPNPYCRADGHGACRTLCANDAECGTGDHCDAAGFCHRADECKVTTDCSPNHHCGLPDGWEDDGYLLCLDDADPSCVDDGHGACRLRCEQDADCLQGGGCSADHLCHASNECASNADCSAGLICYADSAFGGLCGPPRP